MTKYGMASAKSDVNGPKKKYVFGDFELDKVVELVSGGCVISLLSMGPTPSSLRENRQFSKYTKIRKHKKSQKIQ